MNKKGKKRSRLRIESGPIFSDLAPSLDGSSLSDNLSLNLNTSTHTHGPSSQSMNFFMPVYVNQVSYRL